METLYNRKQYELEVKTLEMEEKEKVIAQKDKELE